MNLKEFPLHCDKIIKVYEPNIDFFIDKIENLEYFSMIRFADWWWKTISLAIYHAFGINTLGGLKKDEIEEICHHIRTFNNKYINILGPYLVRAGKSGPYITSVPIMAENLRTTIIPPAQGLFFTVKAERRINQLIVKSLTKRNEFLYAHCWRNFATSGEIHRLFEETSDCHFIVIGPFFHSKFGKKISLNNFSFLKINEVQGYKSVNRTISKIIALRKSIQNKKVVCLFSSGSLSTFMITRLHQCLNDTFLIDVGRALDVYYCHDKVLREGPAWRWSGAWFGPQNNPKEWTRWTRKYRL